MKFCVVFLVIVNSLSCLAGYMPDISPGLPPGCIEAQLGDLNGKPVTREYRILPYVPTANIDLHKDFYPFCPYGPNGVYVRSCESCPHCARPTILMYASPNHHVEIHRSEEALTGTNNVLVTVYCKSA